MNFVNILTKYKRKILSSVVFISIAVFSSPVFSNNVSELARNKSLMNNKTGIDDAILFFSQNIVEHDIGEECLFRLAQCFYKFSKSSREYKDDAKKIFTLYITEYPGGKFIPACKEYLKKLNNPSLKVDLDKYWPKRKENNSRRIIPEEKRKVVKKKIFSFQEKNAGISLKRKETKKKRFKISGDISSEFDYLNIRGDTSGALRAEGRENTENYTLRLDGNLPKNIKSQSLVRLRHTTDYYIDKQIWHIQRYYTKFLHKDWNLTLGSFFADFSPFTLSTSLEGAYAEYRFNKLILKGLWGLKYRSYDFTRYKRYTYGVNGVYTLLKNRNTTILRNLGLGVHYASTYDDDESLIPEKRIGVDPISNDVFTFTSSAELVKNLIVAYEYSHSIYDDNEFDTQPEVKDYAYYIKGTYMWRNLSLGAGYKHTEPYFNSIAGFAANDREEYSGDIRYRFSRYYSCSLNYFQYSDNLNKQLTATTISYTPRITISSQPLPFRRSLRLTTTFSLNKFEKSDNTSNNRSKTYSISLNDKFAGYNISNSFNWRNFGDKIDSANNTKTSNNSFNITRSWRLFKKLSLNTAFNYNTRRHKRISDNHLTLNKGYIFNCNFRYAVRTTLAFNFRYSDNDNNFGTNDSLIKDWRVDFNHNFKQWQFLATPVIMKYNLRGELIETGNEIPTRDNDEYKVTSRLEARF